jgi:hypothetical protein
MVNNPHPAADDLEVIDMAAATPLEVREENPFFTPASGHVSSSGPRLCNLRFVLPSKPMHGSSPRW